MRRSSPKLIAATLGALAIAATTAGVGLAHDSPNEGHIPKDANYGFEVIGRDTLAGVVDGNYTDVWSHNGYAYIGTFQDPCYRRRRVHRRHGRGGRQLPGHRGCHRRRDQVGAEHAHQRCQVHTVGDTDVLITTQEPCGMQIPGWAHPASTARQRRAVPGRPGRHQPVRRDRPDQAEGAEEELPRVRGRAQHVPLGLGGQELPDRHGRHVRLLRHVLRRHHQAAVAEAAQHHRRARLVRRRGFDRRQFETGSSASINNHDNWVEIIDGVPTAVVSYWDARLRHARRDRPGQPVFLDDSTYVDPEPITGEPYEGNAHAAVFGGNGDYIFGGDEDFSPSSFAISYDGVEYPAGVALFGDDPNTLAGNVEYVGGDGCASVPAPTGRRAAGRADRPRCVLLLRQGGECRGRRLRGLHHRQQRR